MWFNASCESQDSLPRWSAGDVVGCFIDIDNKILIFSLNGDQLQPFKQVFQSTSSGFFPAASFMSFQQCEVGTFISLYNRISHFTLFTKFNFGWRPFIHPPEREFQSFNKVSEILLCWPPPDLSGSPGVRPVARGEGDPAETSQARSHEATECEGECLHSVF